MTVRDTVIFSVYALLSMVSVVAWPELSSRNICCAYLDPSTGAMVISAIVGIAATIALGLKTFWYKITAPLRRKKADERTMR